MDQHKKLVFVPLFFAKYFTFIWGTCGKCIMKKNPCFRSRLVPCNGNLYVLHFFFGGLFGNFVEMVEQMNIVSDCLFRFLFITVLDSLLSCSFPCERYNNHTSKKRKT